MSITFATLSKVLPFVVEARMPIIIRGRHGIGKSCLAYALADHLGKDVIERRASQMTEGDLLGLPKISNDRTIWLAPDWLQAACHKGVVLFIDEIDRATSEVRQGFFELCDSRKIAGNHLHPDTLIIAAVNGGEHGSQYQVADMDPAELDRYTVFDVEPSVEDWLNWAQTINPKTNQSQCCKVVVDFIAENHKFLEHSDDFEPGRVYPSRRSWHRLSVVLDKAGEALITLGQLNPLLSSVATGFVGLEASTMFCDFVENYAKVITTDDILNKGRFDLLKDLDINGFVTLVDKFENEATFKVKLSDKQITNAQQFFCHCPSEAAVKFFTVFTDTEIDDNVKRFHADKKVSKWVLSVIMGVDEASKIADTNPTAASTSISKKRTSKKRTK